jgi:hypothetical protein
LPEEKRPLDAEFRNPGRRSVGLRVRGIVPRRPKRREVPAKVQFEVAPNTVTNVTELGAARLRTGPRQGWEEHVVARLKLGSCLHPEQCQIENPPACRACVREAKGSDRALHQNYRIARATAKIGMANLIYNIKPFIFLRKIAVA